MKSTRLGLASPVSANFFSSPFSEKESGPVSPKLDRFSPSSSASSSSSSLSPGSLEAGRLPGPMGRTRFALGRAGRRLVWLAIFLALLLCTYYYDRGFALVSSSSSLSLPPPPGADGTHYSPFYGGPSRRPIDISSDPLPINATLEERLRAWEKAPGGGGPNDVHPADFIAWNLEQCGESIEPQLNRHMVEHYSIGWASMNRTKLGDLRRELIGYMRDVADGPEMRASKELEGHGIVMLAGDGTSLNRVLWSVSMMRSYGSDLPVNVYHFENERPADDDPLRLQLEALNVTLVAVEGIHKAAKGKSYHLKAHGIIMAPWRHVLYLDSDSIPVRDPKYMWEAPNYVRLGVWMTPDYWKTAASNPLWAVSGVKCRNEWENEAGQILVDKSRHMDALLLSRYMLANHDEWFKYSDGDKDILLRWTLIMLRKRWGVPGRYVSAGALPRDTQTGYCGHTMMQHDSWGEVFTVHWNLLKNIPSGLHLGFTWGRSKQLPLFNLWPATPETARLGEPLEKPQDSDRRGLGDIDSDMLADADEEGYARAPATEMVMRRAVREQGVQAYYHGGGSSAFCIDLRYVDPRPASRQEADEAAREAEDERRARLHDQWQADAEAARMAGQPEPPVPHFPETPVQPDWSRSPLEIVDWNNDPALREFERTLYTSYAFDAHWKPPKE